MQLIEPSTDELSQDLYHKGLSGFNDVEMM